METYTGTYAFHKGLDIEITRDGKRIFGKASNGPVTELYPKSANEFYTTAVKASLTFSSDGTTLIFRQQGQELRGTKVDGQDRAATKR